MKVEILVRRVVDGRVSLSVEMVDASLPTSFERRDRRDIVGNGREAPNKQDNQRNRRINNGPLQGH